MRIKVDYQLTITEPDQQGTTRIIINGETVGSIHHPAFTILPIAEKEVYDCWIWTNGGVEDYVGEFNTKEQAVAHIIATGIQLP